MDSASATVDDGAHALDVGVPPTRVRRWEWLSFMPKEGCLPQISQTEGMTGGTSQLRNRVGERYQPTPRSGSPGTGSWGTPWLPSAAMASREHLGADDLRAAIATFRDLLRSHQEPINRLNVYPVPDGDTGTNMALTLESVVVELDGAAEDMASTCKAIGHGSLMGARGNSRRDPLPGPAGPDRVLAEGRRGRRRDVGPGPRRGLVGRLRRGRCTPVEGTILTVVREAAEAAHRGGVGGERRWSTCSTAASCRGPTPWPAPRSMLPVLKEAGVVDAGGAGFLLLLDALLHVAGRPSAARARRRRRCPTRTWR